MRTVFLGAILVFLGLLILSSKAPAGESLAPQVLLVNDDRAAGGWQISATMPLFAECKIGSASSFGEEELSRYKLVVAAHDGSVISKYRDRLLAYVRGGGRLVVWPTLNSSLDSGFYPYKLTVSGNDVTSVQFPGVNHPAVGELCWTKLENVIYGGQTAREWDQEHWQALANSPSGPVMFACSLGEGDLVVILFRGSGPQCQGMMNRLMSNLVSWARVPYKLPPDLRKRTIREIVLAVARRQIVPLREGEWKREPQAESVSSKPPEGLTWSYQWGVVLYGMLRASELNGDELPKQFVMRHNDIAMRHYDYLDWQERTLGKLGETGGLPPLVDFMHNGSMGSQILESALVHGKKLSKEALWALNIIADYITDTQPRMKDGSICRLPYERNRNMSPFEEVTLWADDLYMCSPFLARWGTFSSQPKYWDDAAKQLINYAKRLQDKDGLWWHGWLDDRGSVSPCKWGRANGWALMSEVEVLCQLPTDHPDRDKLLSILRGHINGLKEVQSPSGFWRQVLDRPDLWEETSCTAMFAFGIARACNRGWTDKSSIKIAAKAFEALKSRVSWDGTVIGTGMGTAIGTDVQYYFSRPQPVDECLGVGPVLLAGTELMAAGKE
ncbi:MAG: glycoside hydrolase family 88 protein [Armatimonadetes bacterium]|nr:glycoside hydrolase family 88 protein [Armatimonadota bacterium]